MSIASKYYIRLKDQSGDTVAIFDNFASMEFNHQVNDIGSFRISFYDNGDPRYQLFELDGQVEFWRSSDGDVTFGHLLTELSEFLVTEGGDYILWEESALIPVEWYKEFEGLHRGELNTIDQSGRRTFTSYGVGYNHLLSRRVVGYRAGTIFAEKDDEVELVLKEYIDENCVTCDATRVISANFPNFSVEAASGFTTPDWSGERSFNNLLDLCKELSLFSHENASPPTDYAFDFNVVGVGAALFEFRTYIGQLGTDRTVGSATPVIFSTAFNNMERSEYEVDRIAEANVAVVLGQGDRSTRVVRVRTDPTTIADSPWNHVEIARPATQNTFTYQLDDFGDALLQENYLKEDISGDILTQRSTFYGRDFFVGDLVTVEHNGVSVNKKIIEVKISADGNGQREEISVTFGDIAR